jgi:hypothetical protein
VISLYAKQMTTGDIAAHLEESSDRARESCRRSRRTAGRTMSVCRPGLRPGRSCGPGGRAGCRRNQRTFPGQCHPGSRSPRRRLAHCREHMFSCYRFTLCMNVRARCRQHARTAGAGRQAVRGVARRGRRPTVESREGKDRQLM